MEDIVLLNTFNFFCPCYAVILPHNEWYFVLLSWSIVQRQCSVHKHSVLAQRLSVVRNEYHTAALAFDQSQCLYNRMYKVIGIQDCIVIRIHKPLSIGLGHIYILAYRSEHIELGRVIRIVLGAVACIAMDDNELFILGTTVYLIGKPGKQQAIVATVYPWICFGQSIEINILADTQGRFTPVVCAPHDIHTVAVEIIRKCLIQIVATFVREHSLHSTDG